MFQRGAIFLLLAFAATTGCDPNTASDSSASPSPLTKDETKHPSPEPSSIPDKSDSKTAGSPETTARAPLSNAEQSLFFAGAQDGGDPLPDHYVKSNEIRHDTWFPSIKDLGGAFIGVGPDQCYTMAAAQDADLVFLLDIDRMVVEVHFNYEVLIKASATPQALHQRFNTTQKDSSIAMLEEAYAKLDPKSRRHRIQTYVASRETIYRHLKHVGNRHRGDVMTSWLSNPDYYARIRRLYQENRVRIMDGDLTGPETMKTIGTAATALGVPVNVLYLSNAEEYYKYSRQYARNIQGLAGIPTSVVLRTIYNKAWEHADSLWNYQVQPLADYQLHLQDPAIRARNAMLRIVDKQKRLERTTETKGLSRINMPPVE